MQSLKNITLRPQQIQLLDFVKKNIQDGIKFSLIDAPTGTGKSIFAMKACEMYVQEFDKYATFDVLTNSKILQEQYAREFEFINSLWGKDSYMCDTYNTTCGVGEQMCAAMNKSCDNCPYQTARTNFFEGQISLGNFHMFLTYKLFVKEFWNRQRQSKVLIIDEAHEFEMVLTDFITTQISELTLKKLTVKDNVVTSIMHSVKNCYNIEEFIKIISDILLPALGEALREHKSVITKSTDENDRKKAYEHIGRIEQAMSKYKRFLDDYQSNPANWLLQRDEKEELIKTGVNRGVTKQKIEVTATPIWVSQYMKESVFDMYDHVILMSGTILDKDLFSWMNGIDNDSCRYISLDSPFPVSNRPIYFFKNLGKMNFKDKHSTFENTLPFLNKILNKHKNHKGIIHTSNYELQKWVNERCENEDMRILAHDSSNRSDVLNNHLQTKNPTVLVSPSMMVGVDLAEDLSRFQVLLKVPYPNLQSERVKRRMEMNKDWYGYVTCSSIIQAYGRSIRSKDDKAMTYVTDGCFGDVLKFSSRFFPKWFKEAVTIVE